MGSMDLKFIFILPHFTFILLEKPYIYTRKIDKFFSSIKIKSMIGPHFHKLNIRSNKWVKITKVYLGEFLHGTPWQELPPEKQFWICSERLGECGND